MERIRVVVFAKRGSPIEALSDFLKKYPDSRLVSETAGQAFLIETDASSIELMKSSLPSGWVMAPEVTYAPPQPHREKPQGLPSADATGEEDGDDSPKR